ncbi:MAG: hypothetical protein HZB39_03475 [Planctomycetes bacterium]|nr:hypothetical protein [Planctomycetota bacterium]
MHDRTLATLRGDRADPWHGLLRVGVNAAARVGLGIGVARTAGTESFAIWVALVTVEVLLSTLLMAGWLTALGSIAPRLPVADAENLLAHGCRRGLVLATGTTLALVLATPLATLCGVPVAVHLAFVAATGAWLASQVHATVLVAAYRSASAVRAQALAYLPPLAGIGASALTGADPLVAVFLASAGGQLGAALWMRRAIPRATTPTLPTRVAEEVAAVGRAALLGSVANSVCTRVQPFALAWLGGPIAVALFGAANTLAGPLRVLAGAAGDVLRPRLARHQGPLGDPAVARRLLAFSFAAVAAGGIALVAGCVLFGEGIGTRIFGGRFLGIGEVMPAAAIFVTMAAVVHVLVVALQTRSLEGTQLATRARSIAAAATLVLVGPSCALDGARGAFVSMIAGEVTFLSIVARSLWRSADGAIEPARP